MAEAAEKLGSKVLVRQVRSTIGRTEDVKDTLKALGLGRIGKEKTHTLNKSVLGMLRKVVHLVRVHEVSEKKGE